MPVILETVGLLPSADKGVDVISTSAWLRPNEVLPVNGQLVGIERRLQTRQWDNDAGTHRLAVSGETGDPYLPGKLRKRQPRQG